MGLTVDALSMLRGDDSVDMDGGRTEHREGKGKIGNGGEGRWGEGTRERRAEKRVVFAMSERALVW